MRTYQPCAASPLFFQSAVRTIWRLTLEESARCLQCDLRLKIKAVKFWGNY